MDIGMMMFEEKLNELKEEFEGVYRNNRELVEKLKNWNKDDEIQKLENRIRKGYLIPEDIMEKIEASKEKHFRKSETCDRKRDISITIVPTELGDSIKCKCLNCGKILCDQWNG